MPILDPTEAYYLINNSYRAQNLKKFFHSFLPIASEHIFTNVNTINVYEQFSQFFDVKYNDIASILDITIPDYQPFSIENYFDYLYNLIDEQLNDDEGKIKYLKNKIDFYEIILSNSNYSIFISPLSYAILAIRDKLDRDEALLIQLLSFILAASGHILVLAVSEYAPFSFISSLIDSSLFNECHLFFNSDSSITLDYFTSKENIYFYIYVSTKRQNNKKEISIDNPYIHIFYIAVGFGDIFDDEKTDYELISYLKDEKGNKIQIQFNDKFDVNKIVITLYNSQLYDSNDVKKCFIPKKIENYAKVFINASDFLYWQGQRINCYTTLSQTQPLCYLDFNDMHFMKLDYHVENPLYLIPIDFWTLFTIDEVIDNIKYSTGVGNRIKSLSSNTEKYVEEKLLYAFHKIWKHFNHIIGYSSQIYTVHHAINYLSEYFVDSNSENHRGCIYQVKTGEGKSIIICALAEIFARMGKTVHIVTSNIVLACRDYEKSHKYFTSCKFKPSILLHQTEYDQIECECKSYYYPSSNPTDFYHSSWFDNPSTMNIKIFEKGYFKTTSEIIFSTFFNFEGWYLRQKEENPIQLEEYLKDCYLIIDESDTILIDELTNGTIIAREMKSKGNEILQKVYDLYIDDNKNATQILAEIKNLWPECNDIDINNVNSMIKDIEYAQKFEIGSKYIIQKDKKGVNQIIPFDSEHKGITESEKEFSGFIHQFIGIKENKKNPNLKIAIRPLSLNYLFISHPIFVKSYKGVWGFTGTIGTDKDIDILNKYYKLDTFEIPLHTVSFRKDLPSIICSNKIERNEKILEEIKFFNQKFCPVLVIFEQNNEIDEFKDQLLKILPENKILTFDGTKLDKTAIEKNSGNIGMVTLGTNFCGRGTDIEYSEDFPLHVIIAYGPRNVRALHQAYGRTGRNGKPGTTRIICTIQAYHKITKIPNEELINKVLNEYDIKKEKQFKFINQFSENRPWIFNSNLIKPRNFTDDEKEQLRDVVINVNRVTAINYQYPICMSNDTFINIQLQKIYSLKNCPECFYTWMLFQRYLRELILESWSIFIDKLTRDYELEIEQNKEIKDDNDYYEKFFETNYRKFEIKVLKILPTWIDLGIIDVFMRIHNLVDTAWSDLVLNEFPPNLRYFKKESEKQSFIAYKTGFYPFELKNKSGARVSYMYEEEEDENEDKKARKKKKEKKKIRIIEDPELRYLMKEKKFSITYIIDIIFEKICSFIEDQLSNYLGIHFYVRRTLSGCEFGVCIDPMFEDIHINKFHCLIDKNPLLLCALICKSIKPFLAAVLMIVLALIAIIAGYIAKYIAVPEFGIKDALQLLRKYVWKTIKKKAKKFATDTIAKLAHLKSKLVKIMHWLHDIILDSIDYDEDNPIYSLTFAIMGVFSKKRFQQNIDPNDDTIKIKFIPDVEKILKDMEPSVLITKIAILVILLIATFIQKFRSVSELKSSASAYQSEFAKNQRWNDSNLAIFYLNADDEIEDYKSYNKAKQKVENNCIANEIDDDDDDDRKLPGIDDE